MSQTERHDYLLRLSEVLAWRVMPTKLYNDLMDYYVQLRREHGDCYHKHEIPE